MSSPVVDVPRELSVQQALTLMHRRGIHSIGSLAEPASGVVTTTDIRDKIVTEDFSPGDVTVREIMNSLSSAQDQTGR
jgi:predicted transcriptional regulator